MRLWIAAAAVLLVAADRLPQKGEPGHIPSAPELGKAEAQCRANEPGPAVLMRVEGLKDREGNLKSELYPANDEDFLQDDNLLIMAGKTFRRIEVPVPKSGEVVLCIRVPGPGNYSLILLHDRDSNRKFGLSSDGVAFLGNPKMGLSKPKSAAALIAAGPGLTRIAVRLNYRRGLFSFGPIKGLE